MKYYWKKRHFSENVTDSEDAASTSARSTVAAVYRHLCWRDAYFAFYKKLGLLVLAHLSPPSVSAGNLFQEPCRYPNPQMLKFLCSSDFKYMCILNNN